jgi:hypothetical protein
MCGLLLPHVDSTSAPAVTPTFKPLSLIANDVQHGYGAYLVTPISPTGAGKRARSVIISLTRGAHVAVATAVSGLGSAPAQ